MTDDSGWAAWSSAAKLLFIEYLIKAVTENQQSDNNFKSAVYASAAKHLAMKGHPVSDFSANLGLKAVSSAWLFVA